MKGTFSNSRRGFTLVELVVVIAIIAILSGVGFAAYNGYIEYAQKGADRQTVGEIMHALEIADYADPGLFGERPTGTVYLSADGIVGDTDAVKRAISDAGLDFAKLKYEWENASDAAAVKSVIFAKIQEKLSYVGESDGSGGTIKIGYADVASECWDAVKQTAELLAKKEGFDSTGDLNAEAVMFVMEAAMKARDHTAKYEWSSFNPTYDGGTLGSALPSYLARNYAFADYLEKNYDYAGIEEDLAKLRSVEELMEHPTTPKDYLTDNASENEQLQAAAQAYLNNVVFTRDGKQMKQADIDCEAYYTFMEGMYEQYQSNLESWEEQDPAHPEDPEKKVTRYKYTGDIEGFWSEAESYISTAAQLAAMSQAERERIAAALPDSGRVVQVVVNGRNDDGTLKITPYPQEAAPDKSSGAQEGCSHEHSPASIDIDLEYDEERDVTLCLTAGVTKCTLNAKNRSGSSSFDSADKISKWNSSHSFVEFEGGDSYITITAKTAGSTSIKIVLGRSELIINITVEK